MVFCSPLLHGSWGCWLSVLELGSGYGELLDTKGFTGRAVLIVGVSFSSSPRGAWCCCWFLPPHSRLCFWLVLCFPTCFYTLLFLPWTATPHYPRVQYVCSVLNMLDTFSFISLKSQVCLSLATYRWIFIALGSWVLLCARSDTDSCLHSSALCHVSPLLRPQLW